MSDLFSIYVYRFFSNNEECWDRMASRRRRIGGRGMRKRENERAEGGKKGRSEEMIGQVQVRNGREELKFR